MNAAHSGEILVADTVRSRTKDKLEGIDLLSSMGGEVSAKNAERCDAMLGNNLSGPPGKLQSGAY